MRRDLAVCRYQRGVRQKSDLTTKVEPQNGLNNTTAINLDDDIVMGESPVEQAKSSPPKEVISLPEGEQASKPDSPLHVDIPGQDHQAAGHPGDENTGTYSNFDFESLFNDPSSTPKDIRSFTASTPIRSSTSRQTSCPRPNAATSQNNDHSRRRTYQTSIVQRW
jgi:hypothetical protein